MIGSKHLQHKITEYGFKLGSVFDNVSEKQSRGDTKQWTKWFSRDSDRMKKRRSLGQSYKRSVEHGKNKSERVLCLRDRKSKFVLRQDGHAL